MQVLKDDIQESILNSAKKLFLYFGYEKTSIEKIAKEAGISKSNLYNYFKSKDEIFYKLTDSAAFQFQKVINFFDENRFTPKFGDSGFSEMFSQYIFQLIKNHKEGLILIMRSSDGTKYAHLKERLIKQIAEKFLRDFPNEFDNAEILIQVITENLFDGITTIVIQSKTDQELEKLLFGYIKYHSCGFLGLISH